MQNHTEKNIIVLNVSNKQRVTRYLGFVEENANTS